MYGVWVRSLLLVPLVALLVGALGVPLLDSMVDSLSGGDSFGSAYAKVFESASFWSALRRTIWVASVVSIAGVTIGYCVAAFLEGCSTTGRYVGLAVVMLPVMSNTIAKVYGWVGVFQRGGLVDQVAALFGFGPANLMYSKTAVAVGMLHSVLPMTVLVLLPALTRYDKRLSQSARALGAGPIRTLFTVKLPVLVPQIFAAAILAFAFSLGFFLTPAILGGGQTVLISVVIQQQLASFMDMARIQAMSMMLLSSVLVLVVALWLIAAAYDRWRFKGQ